MKKVRWLILLGVYVALSLGHATAAEPPYAAAYAASTDLREFVDGRAASPKDGSFFYAFWARWECMDDGGIARRVAKETPPSPGSAQEAALRKELERCRNMPANVAGGTMQRDDVVIGRKEGDKMFAKFDGKNGSWFYVDNQSTLQFALHLMSAANDPNMVWVLAQKLAGLGMYRIAINGQRPNEETGRSVYAAFLLAACDLNVDCGKSHRWMRTWCIQNAECSDVTIEAYWQRVDQTRHEMEWALINQYRSLIGAAARSGDWSSFVLLPD